MKNIYLLTLSLLFICSFSSKTFSQTFFIEAGAQYGTPILGENKAISTLYRFSIINDFNIVRETEDGIFSVGEGFQGNLTLGVTLNENIFFSLKSAYFQSKKVLAHTRTDRYVAGDFIQTSESKSSAITFSPMLNYQTNSEKKLNVFMGMGLIVALPKYEQIEQSSFLDDLWHYTYEYNNDVTFGLENQLGVLYQITPKLDFKASLNIRVLKFYPKSASLTTAEFNGDDVLETLTTYEKEQEFGNDFSYYDQFEHENVLYLLPIIDENISEKRELFAVPISTIAFDLGVRYSF